MVDILLRVVINAIALVAAVYFVPHIKAPNELWQLALVAAIFGLINAYLKPLVKLLSLPLNLLFFGLVGLIVNTAMLLVLALISGQLDLGFTIARWPNQPFSVEVIVYGVLAALVISVVSSVLALVRVLVPRM
jgi:putative membrane protein